MAIKSRRAYKGAAISNTLSAPLNNTTDFTISLSADMSGFPESGTPFFCVIDPGTSKEEKVCVVYTSARVLTCVDPAVTSGWTGSVDGRGVDNTVKQSHIASAVIYPVFTAYEANEANELVSKYASTGAMVYQDASTFATLALGTSGYPLLAGASAPAWSQVDTVGIADNAVTSAKIAANTIVQGDVATALLKLVCPVGTISAYPGATAPTGWLLCTGVSTTGYTELIDLVGATTPDLRGRVPLGKTASGTGSTLLGTGGARKIASGNLPTHAHSLDHDHAAFNYTHDHASFNTADGGAHTHTISDPGHVHTFSTDNNLATEFAGNAAFGNYNPDVNTNTSSAGTGISVTSTNSAHAHAIDVPSHTGSVDVPSFSGTVTTTFANDDFFEPFVSVNYIIKHDY